MQTVLDSIGVSIWQMAMAPFNHTEPKSQLMGNGHLNNNSNDESDNGTSGSEDDSDSVKLHEESVSKDPSVAIACDDGCVRIYSIPVSDELVYTKTFPRVSGEISTPCYSASCRIFFVYIFLKDFIFIIWCCLYRATSKCGVEF